MAQVYDVVIVGGGPAGLTAGLYAARAGLNALIIEKECIGGQVMNLDVVENFPGCKEIAGPELGSQMIDQAMKAGAEITMAEVTRIDARQSGKVIATDFDEYVARAVIIAGGGNHVKLGVPGEEEGAGSFVCYCATCDGPRFGGRHLAMVGGGDTAITDALYLSKFAKSVTVIHRRDKLRATKVLQDRAFSERNIAFRWTSVVDAIERGPEGAMLSLRDVNTGGGSSLAVAAVFVGIGLQPNTQFVGGLLQLGPNGEIPVDENLETAIPGIFAAGDSRAHSPRQIVSAAGDGAAAVASALRYLISHPQAGSPDFGNGGRHAWD